jgi:hypothetical protein
VAFYGAVVRRPRYVGRCVARVWLNMLRSRNARREESLGVHLPDPVISPEGALQPEERRCWPIRSASPPRRARHPVPRPRGWRSCSTRSSGWLSRRSPRGRSSRAARQLARRAPRRVKSAEIRAPDPALGRRDVADAFFRAARDGDVDALVALLHPEVVLLSDFGAKRLQGDPWRGGRRPPGTSHRACSGATRPGEWGSPNGRHCRWTALRRNGFHRRRGQDRRDRRDRRPGTRPQDRRGRS